MASLMDWIAEEYGESHAVVYHRLVNEIWRHAPSFSYQVLHWQADVCTMGEDSAPLEEALNDACKCVRPYFSIRLMFHNNLFEEWKFYSFATTWVVRIEREGAPCVMAVLVSEPFRSLDAKGYRT